MGAGLLIGAIEGGAWLSAVELAFVIRNLMTILYEEDVNHDPNLFSL